MFSKSPEEIARRDAERAAAEERREAERFAESPAGRAKAAAEAGAGLFQIELTLTESKAAVIPMMTAYSHTSHREHANSLDAIEAQGWRLEHASYVFRMIGTESRDKFMSSGQQVAVSGEVVGIYTFRRSNPSANS
jgi:hypothetical protein